MSNANVKGTSVVTIRKIFEAGDPEVQRKFMASLTPDLLDLYQQCLNSTWSPVEKQARFFQAAAQALFPGQGDSLHRLGRALADKNYSGIYRIFLRIPTVAYVIGKNAQIWSTYYDQGSARAEVIGPKHAQFAVAEFPELLRPLREVIGGHISLLLERTGAKRVTVKLLEDNPRLWRWDIVWE